MLAGLAGGLALLCKQEFGLVCYVLLAFVLLMETALHRSVRVLLRSIALCTPGVVLWALVYGWIFWSLTPSFMLFDNWVEIPGSYYMRIYGAHWAAFVGLRFNPFELAVLVISATIYLVVWFWIAWMSRSRIGIRPFVAAVVLLALADRVAPVLATDNVLDSHFIHFPTRDVLHRLRLSCAHTIQIAQEP